MSLSYPDTCPFLNRPSPKGHLTLGHGPSRILAHLRRRREFENGPKPATLSIPTSCQVVLLSVFLKVATLFFFWGSVLACFTQSMGSPSVIFVGVALAVLCQVTRNYVLRKVEMDPPWGSYARVRFQSKEYAERFSELNGLHMEPH